MRHGSIIWFTPWALAIGLALLLAGCGALSIGSHWRKTEISIDGQDQDWRDVDGEKYAGLTVKALNDADFLYLCVSADEASVKSQFTGAKPWTLRFLPKFGEEGAWGLRIERKAAGAHWAGVTGGPEEHDPAAGLQAVMVSGTSRDEEGRPVDAARDGIEFAAHELYGTLVLEFKLPIHSVQGSDLSLGRAPGQSLGLCLLLPPPSAMDRPHGHGGGGGGGRHGGRHGGGGGMGGGMGGPAGMAAGGGSGYGKGGGEVHAEETPEPARGEPEGEKIEALNGSIHLAAPPR